MTTFTELITACPSDALIRPEWIQARTSFVSALS